MSVLRDALLYIDGTLRPSSDKAYYDNIGPWTGEVVGRAAEATRSDIDAAIAAARRAFDDTDWSTNTELRVTLVRRLLALFEENEDLLIDIARHEVGAPMVAVRRAQVGNCLSSWRDLLDVFPQVRWKEDFGTKDANGTVTQRWVMREPVGVVGAITPWNFPMYMNAEKLVSALLAGCTVILKPAPDTPLAGAIFGDLADQAGFPPGVINVIVSSAPALAGEMLVKDPRVDLISFTGSTQVGRNIMQDGAATLKRLFLELGGKSAAIVLEDTPDFARIVAQSILVFHAGQGCAVQSRLLVPRNRYEEAKQILAATYAAFSDKWGHFEEESCVMGPVISRKQRDRIKEYVDIGLAEGATLLAGGNIAQDKGNGWFIEPTCFVDVRNDMRIAQEEIFGPVLVVIPYDDDEDAIRIANASMYGLSGSIWSADETRALAMAQRIRTGSVSVNGGSPVHGDLPFGGFKQSGIGRAWGVEGIEEYLETKVIGINVS